MKRLAMLPILFSLGMFTLGAVGCGDDAADDTTDTTVDTVETEDMDEVAP
ncbi:MAG TPA: hypothetical protein VMR20_02005 [Verrucomicrobiae bacterium]|nr:hypothetical protein [Verrucomicrobiae bacterium]